MSRKEAAGGDWVAGVNPVLEQLRRDPRAIRQVLIGRGVKGGAADVAAEARRAGVEVSFADARRLRNIAGGLTYQGVVALIEGFRYADWYDLVAQKPPCLLFADQVTDPRNFGALIRCADGAGVGGVVVPRERSSPVNAVVAMAAAGATAFVPVARVVNLARALEDAKKIGYWVIGLDGGAQQSVFRFEFPPLSALVVGAEGKGLRPLTRATCDHLLSVPMVGRVASLNVSVAVAVALYERVRQRQPSKD